MIPPRRFGQTDMHMIFMRIEKTNPPSLYTLFPFSDLWRAWLRHHLTARNRTWSANEKHIMTEF